MQPVRNPRRWGKGKKRKVRTPTARPPTRCTPVASGTGATTVLEEGEVLPWHRTVEKAKSNDDATNTYGKRPKTVPEADACQGNARFEELRERIRRKERKNR